MAKSKSSGNGARGGNDTDPVPGVSIAGITPTWNGSSNTALDSFFSDTTLKTLQTINPAQSVTGPNGATFLQLGSDLGTASGVGGAASCTRIDGAPGILTTSGALVGTAAGIMSFKNIEVVCN